MTLLPQRSRFGFFAREEERARLIHFAQDVIQSLPDSSFSHNEARRLLEALNTAPVLEAPVLEGVVGPLGHVIADLLDKDAISVLRKHQLQYPAAKLHDRSTQKFEPAKEPTGPVVPPDALGGTALDYEVLTKQCGLPFGTPATPFTAIPAWVRYFTSNGFNVITGQTVRSTAHDGYVDPPHVRFTKFPEIFLDTFKAVRVSIDPGELDEILYTESAEALSSINSVGIPCPEPDIWMDRVSTIVKTLQPHQIYICSVVGAGDSLDQIVGDFVRVSRMAEDAGASAIELNLSYLRPPARIRDEEGELYCESARLTEAIVQAVSEALNASTSLIAKLAFMETARLRTVLGPVLKYLDGVSGINAVPATISSIHDDEPVYDDGRTAAVAGATLKQLAQRFVKDLSDLRRETLEYFSILASGGVMTADDAIALRSLGADAVQSATAAYINPFLAWDVWVRREEFGLVPGDRQAYEMQLASNREFLARESRSFVPPPIARAILG
jgi:dihydroorotate dehydrogenase